VINTKNDADLESQSNRRFFSKRNTIIIVLAFFLSIILIALTLVYILRIHWDKLLKQLIGGFSNQLG
jgi:hypothetical protein